VDLFPLAYRADPAFKMKLLRRSPLTEQANRDLKPGRIGAVFKRGRKAISHTDGDISALSASLLRASVWYMNDQIASVKEGSNSWIYPYESNKS